MKQKETTLNSLLIDQENSFHDNNEIGDNHIGSSSNTPLRDDAFDLSDDEKIKKIEGHFREIMLRTNCGLRPASF